MEDLLNLSVIAKISYNLRDALDQQQFSYNGTDEHITTAEFQRTIIDINNRYPFIEVCGPWPETTWRGNDSVHAKLWYRIEFRENSINDTAPGALPIIETMINTGADLVKMIMKDMYRGGNAILTRCEMPGYYFTGDMKQPEFVIYTDVCVEAFINQNDPYISGV
jgi:hypothetical protein